MGLQAFLSLNAIKWEMHSSFVTWSWLLVFHHLVLETGIWLWNSQSITNTFTVVAFMDFKTVISLLFSVLFISIKYLHVVVQPWPLPLSRTFPSSQTETLFPLNLTTHSSFSQTLTPSILLPIWFLPLQTAHVSGILQHFLPMWWEYFIYHYILKVHWFCRMYKNFISF